MATLASQNNNLYVRVRHTGQLLACQIESSDDLLTVSLTQPARGLADGQAGVFYTHRDQHLCCLGGGEIVNFTV